MKKERQRELRTRADILKAMAHPSRLLIIEELAEKNRCVHELTALVGADISTVSKHLSVLREAGIVEGLKRGSQVFYELQFRCIMPFFQCIEYVLALKSQPECEVCQFNEK